MIDRLLDHIAPHACCSCGQQRDLLCDNCYFDIKDEPYVRCVVCTSVLLSDNICRSCSSKTNIKNAWVVGVRTGSLKTLINLYKFERTKQAGLLLAKLLHDRVPTLDDAIVCYIPDISSHKRQRGYDHMRYVAKQFAQMRNLSMQPLLSRKTHISQRGLSRKERMVSQEDAFTAEVADSPILLIDDIYTTGSTIQAAVDAFRGKVPAVYVGIIARQPLDDSDDL